MPRFKFMRPKVAAVLAVTVGLGAAATGYAVADSPTSGQVIRACANVKTGELRIPRVGPGRGCKQKGPKKHRERIVAWNKAGVRGATGATGKSGKDGLQGLLGSAGPQGPQGKTGTTGPQGPQGEDGAQGLIGEIGPAGARGADGAVGGPGATGDTGPKGDTGPAGPQGATGLKGDDGNTGPAGPAGPPGAAGTGASKTATMRASGDREINVSVGNWTATGLCRSFTPPAGDGYRDLMTLTGPQDQQMVVTTPRRQYEAANDGTAFFAAGAEQRTLQVVTADGNQGATLVAGRYRNGDDCVMILTLIANP